MWHGPSETKPINTFNISRDELIWLAGFIDGEGHIGIHKNNSYTSSRITSKDVYYEVAIEIVNTDTETMAFIMGMIGGKIYRRSGKGKGRETLNLKLRDREDVWNLLHLLLPFLVTKKSQAKGIISFLSTSDSNKQKEIYELMGVINKPGLSSYSHRKVLSNE